MEPRILVEDWTGEVICRIPENKLSEWKRHCSAVYGAEESNSMGEHCTVPTDPEWAETLGIVVDRHY